MGRNSKPLVIHVLDTNVYKSEAVKRLEAKGHTVTYCSDCEGMDVVIGSQCWRIDPQLKLGDDSTQEESLERQLEMMEKSVRAIKYPKEKKDATSK